MHFAHIMESGSEQDRAKFCAGYCPDCLGVCNCQVGGTAAHAGSSCAAARADRQSTTGCAARTSSTLSLPCFEHAPSKCTTRPPTPPLPFEVLRTCLRPLLLLQKHLHTEQGYAPPHFSNEQMAEYSSYMVTSLAPHVATLLQEEADEVRHALPRRCRKQRQ